jgi:putative phosphoribosyl transferase
MSNRIFQDRQDAGRQLAQSLIKYKNKQPLILGIPRGGVIVAYEVAKALLAELDVIVARKLGAPLQPELAIGAIAPGNIKVLNPELVQYFGLDDADINKLVEQEQQEMERRISAYRAGRADLDVKNRTVIIVDDGLATGLTALAAVRAVKNMQAKKVILAVPVGAADTVATLSKEAIVVCLSTPQQFDAVGYWYRDFAQVTDAEVIALLK